MQFLQKAPVHLLQRLQKPRQKLSLRLKQIPHGVSVLPDISRALTSLTHL